MTETTSRHVEGPDTPYKAAATAASAHLRITELSEALQHIIEHVDQRLGELEYALDQAGIKRDEGIPDDAADASYAAGRPYFDLNQVYPVILP